MTDAQCNDAQEIGIAAFGGAAVFSNKWFSSGQSGLRDPHIHALLRRYRYDYGQNQPEQVSSGLNHRDSSRERGRDGFRSTGWWTSGLNVFVGLDVSSRENGAGRHMLQVRSFFE